MFKYDYSCLLHASNIMCSSSGRRYSSTFLHLLECLHKCTKSKPYKTSRTNGLPYDEHKMFETCGRNQELN